MTVKIQHIIGFGAGSGAAAEPIVSGIYGRTTNTNPAYFGVSGSCNVGDHVCAQMVWDGTTGNPGNATGNSSTWTGINEGTSSTNSFTFKCFYTTTLAAGDVGDTTIGVSMFASRNGASRSVGVTPVADVITTGADTVDTSTDTTLQFPSRTTAASPSLYVAVGCAGVNTSGSYGANCPNGRGQTGNSSGAVRAYSQASNGNEGTSFGPNSISLSSSAATSASTFGIR